MTRPLIICLLLVFTGLAAVGVGVAHSALSMSENGQINRIRNMEAKFHCLAKTSRPVYEHVKVVAVPLSHVEFVTDTDGTPLLEGSTGTDINKLIVTLTTRKGGNGFLDGYIVNEGCFLLPPAR